MTGLPVCSGRTVRRVLEQCGFAVVRVAGSHHVMRNPGPPQITVTVPIHGNRPLKRATLASILKQSKLTVEAFVALL